MEARLAESANARAARVPAVELWRRTVTQIPTTFGKLVYLASLRDPATGRYLQETVGRVLGADDTDRTLCHTHHQVFSQWLSYGLLEQKADLAEYLRASHGPRYSLQYRHLVPRTAREVERLLYLTDLETLLELLRYEQGEASAEPEA